MNRLPPPPPPPPVKSPARGPSGPRTIIGTAVLSAVLASLVTVGLATSLSPAVAPVAAPVPTPNAQLAADSPSTEEDLADVVSASTPSVVTITAEGVARDRFSPFSIPATGVGSGIIVTADGLILTNNHVVAGADRLTVTLANGEDVSAEVVETDPAHDMAVIRADTSGLTPARLGDSDQVKVGETVLAIGSPLGEFTETVTKGIVSALGRTINLADEQTGRAVQMSGLLQTDAAINPGNSGGPLISVTGEVIGLNSAVAQAAEGIGFAIPINDAKSLISQATGA